MIRITFCLSMLNLHPDPTLIFSPILCVDLTLLLPKLKNTVTNYYCNESYKMIY